MVSFPSEPSIPRAHYPNRAYKTKISGDRIRKESKMADLKNLPFTFSKPKRQRIKPDIHVCENCGRESNINKQTCVLIACPCGYLNYIKEEGDKV